MSVLIVALLTPVEGGTQDLLDLFEAKSPAIRAHELCLLFAVHRQGDAVVVIEKWATDEATRQPDLRAAIDQIASRIGSLLAVPPDVRRLTAIDQGAKSII